MTPVEQIEQIINEARTQNWPIEDSLNGRQIVFDNGKKLHEGHLKQLCPAIFEPNARISALIDGVAPGRPCAHKPMREIIQAILAKKGT